MSAVLDNEISGHYRLGSALARRWMKVDDYRHVIGCSLDEVGWWDHGLFVAAMLRARRLPGRWITARRSSCGRILFQVRATRRGRVMFREQSADH